MILYSMMYSNHDLTIDDKHRVFNIFISPRLREIYGKNTNAKCLFFAYDFRDEKIEFGSAGTMEGLKKLFIKYDPVSGLNQYDFLTMQVVAKKDDVYLAIIYFGPKGSIDYSLYALSIEEIMQNTPMTMGDPPKKYVPDKWFTHDFLTELFGYHENEMKRIAQIDQHKKTGKLNVYSSNNGRLTVRQIQFEIFQKICNDALVPLDKQELIKKEYQKSNGEGMIIFVHICYLVHHLLAVRYYREGKKYQWRSIRTLGETSPLTKKKSSK